MKIYVEALPVVRCYAGTDFYSYIKEVQNLQSKGFLDNDFLLAFNGWFYKVLSGESIDCKLIQDSYNRYLDSFKYYNESR
jgi:hypothetical protein